MGINHVRNYTTIKGVELVAISDVDRRRGKKIANQFKTKYYQDYNELFKKEKIDAVSIVVPTILHKKVALDVIKRGIPFLLEKPIANNVKDAIEIINQAERNKLSFLVGHVERYNPAVVKLQQLVKAKAFGEILSIVVKRVGLPPEKVKNIDVVTDLAVHDLDIITTLMGRIPKLVYAKGKNRLTKERIDHAEIFLDYGDCACFIQVNWLTPIKVRNLSITGTKGYAELDYVRQKINLYENNFKIKQPKGFADFVVKFSETPRKQLNLGEKEPLRIELENFINTIKGKESFAITPQEALNALILSEAVIESIKSNKAILIKK